MRGQHVEVAPTRKPSARPADEKRHPMSTVEQRAFRALHAGVESLAVAKSGRRTVVGREDQNRVLGQPQFVQLRYQPAHVFVDIGDHPVESGVRYVWVVGVEVAVLLGHVERAVRGVGHQISKERPLAVRLDEFHRRVEPNVGAIPVKLLRPAVAEIRIIEIRITPIVGRLPHTTPAMNQHLAKTSILRPERIIIPQVPLPKAAGLITTFGKHLGHRHRIGPRQRPPPGSPPSAHPHRILPGHQPGSRRSTTRRDMKIRQSHRLPVKRVQVRSLDDRVTVTSQVAVSLVVGHYQNHVRPRSRNVIRPGQADHGKNPGNE